MTQESTHKAHLRRELATVGILYALLIAGLVALFYYEQQTGHITQASIQFYNWLLHR